MLPASIIPIIAAASHNNTVRALLLAHLKQEPPKDCVTYQQIVDWVEYTFEKPEDPATKMYREEQARRDRELQEIRRAQEERERNSVHIHVEASDHEDGSCSYSCDVRGEGNVPVHKREFVEMASDCDDSDELWNRLEESLYDEAENRISLEPVQDSIRIIDRDGDHDGIGVTIPEAARNTLKELLRTEAPEVYNHLFGQ